jgi:hypothetical protein
MLNTGHEIETPYFNAKNRHTSKKHPKSDSEFYVLNETFQIHPSKYIFKYLIRIYGYLKGLIFTLWRNSIHKLHLSMTLTRIAKDKYLFECILSVFFWARYSMENTAEVGQTTA